MSRQRSFATVGPAPGRPGRRVAVQALRVLSWAVPATSAWLALGGGLAAWLFWPLGIASLAFAYWYRRFLADYARSLAAAPHGSLEVTPDRLVVRHPGVLADEATIAWSAVRAVCVDDGAEPDDGPAVRPARFRPTAAGTADPGTDALFAGRSQGRKRRRGIPLLAPAPVVPNLLVLLDPPADVPWHYPFVASPFNPPRGTPWPASPWPAPTATPAFFAALADPAGFAAAVAGHAPVRDAEPADARYLEDEGLGR